MRKFFAILLLLTGSALGQIFPAKYHTYAEAIFELDSLASSNPAICWMDSIGVSTRDSITIWALKISDNVIIDEDEPAAFFCAGVHADELLGVEVALGFAKDIVSKYNLGDTAAVNYVNNIEIFIVPFINPEGHIVVESGDLDWRKNKCDNDHNGIFDYHDGVDNNRNYDFGWSIDTDPGATTPESLMYKGTAPFTQSENIAMATFAWKYRPMLALDYHSPTYGRSEVAYYNWYWYSTDGGHGFAPDEALMKQICDAYCFRIINDAGDSCYEARRALVNKGDFKTYFYGNFGTVSFSVEISDTTIQDTSLVDGIVARHLPGEYYLLQRILGPGITGIIRDSLTDAPLEAEVQVLERINADINPRLSRPDYGRYRRVLAPGTYTLRFIKNGYQTRTINSVVVANGPPTVVNVKLYPTGTPPPPTPILAWPTDGASLDTNYVTLRWHPSALATGYVVEIGLDSLFAGIFERDSVVVDTFYSNTLAFQEGNYFWRITAFNSGGYSGRSDVRDYRIVLLPETPILIWPPNNHEFDSGFVDFAWHRSQRAREYIIEIATDSLFANVVFEDSTLNDTTLGTTGLTNPGRYFWRLRAKNIYGYSNYSQIRAFRIANSSISYMPGDVNGDSQVMGSDVTYLVRYFKGLGLPPPVEVNGFYPGADANGDCQNRGGDVTYLVAFFKGGPPPVDGHCF